MAEEPTGGFLRSLPGVMTASAALVTAVGGLVGALVAAGIIGPNKPHTTAPSAAAANSMGHPASHITPAAPSAATANSAVERPASHTPSAAAANSPVGSPASHLTPAAPSAAAANVDRPHTEAPLSQPGPR